jgi:hypothetical protein
MAVGDIPRYVERHPREAKKSPVLTWSSSAAFWASPDFSGFIRNDALSHDSASKTQIEFLTSDDGKVRCRAYRLEDQAAWLPELRRKLACDFVFPNENVSPKKLIAPADVGADDVRHIESRHAADYAAFGY